MKILVLTPWFPSHREDQQGNFILDSIESLVDLGHELTVLVTQPWRPKAAKLFSRNWIKKEIQVEQFSDKFNLCSCHYLSIPRSFMAWLSYWFYRKRINPLLEKLVQQYRCQLIHAHTELAGVAAVDVGHKLHVPTVVTMHGISTDTKLYKGKNRKLLFEYTLSKSDRVILVGKPLLNFSKQFVKDQNHFRIIWNGFRSGKKHSIANKKEWLENSLRFISVSNLVEGKGIDLNLYALSQLKVSGITNWTYKIVGDGVERKNLETLAEKLNLTEHVIFFGACDHHKVYDYLAQSDVFILPSYREAFGVAYLEAMSFGLLTIGVRGQGPEEFIEHEKTGLLIPPKNVDILASTLKSIFTTRNKMQEIAKNGQLHVRNNFTWAAHARNLENVYKELI